MAHRSKAAAHKVLVVMGLRAQVRAVKARAILPPLKVDRAADKARENKVRRAQGPQAKVGREPEGRAVEVAPAADLIFKESLTRCL